MIRPVMDTRTLVITLLVHVTLLGVLAIYFSFRQPGTRAVGTWGIGLLMMAAGLGGIALRGTVPDLLSITVANAIAVGSNLLFYRAIRIFKGRSVHDPLGAAVLTATVILVYVFSDITPSLQARLVMISAVSAFFFARNALELRGEMPPEVRTSQRFMHGLFWIVAALMVARLVFSLQVRVTDVMAPSAGQSSYFLAILLLATAASFGMFWMQIQALNLELARQAARDSLTGMFNRRSFMLELDRELARVRRGGTVLSVAMFDLDHFKDLNDAHGHQAGDEVLRGIAACMQATVRQPDILGRYGGEEFVLLMPDTDAGMAMRVCERIRVEVQMNGVEWNGRRLSITISGGVAAFALHGMAADTLIAAADAALYAAKHAGRNRVLQAAARPAGGALSDIHATPKQSIRNPQ